MRHVPRTLIRYPKIEPAGNIAAQAIKVYDRDFGAKLEAVFAEDERHCREITYESWKRRSLEQRLAEIVSGAFEPLY